MRKSAFTGCLRNTTAKLNKKNIKTALSVNFQSINKRNSINVSLFINNECAFFYLSLQATNFGLEIILKERNF